ncbi:class I SAM-dependent methyltransferase [Baekduia soli]|uniref:Class I SAM-dependent methyltransferase n=1 Tax=Baekduia soli TaxID=496014 RepID=A0A5B8U3M5_9ACTN|nr:cyclopropane-fatty-acyl-phospholipid synthase family protein [Baekduia soli]QEC47590.1 class I SAM-dependent methyltransferase [Baekduia soli]
MTLSSPTALREELQRALPDRPFSIDFWDGTTLPPTNGTAGPTLTVRSPKALAHAIMAPGQLGIGRAYVSGELDVDDLDAALVMLDTWRPPALHGRAKARLAGAALRSTGIIRPPRPPQAELRPRGRRHSPLRDRRAVRHHYDVSNEYFSLFLDESMTYSCAIFSRGAKTLEEAQFTKRELVCTKLGLQPGERVLDVGCGWGAFALHAAVEHGVHVTGITLSEPQAQLARQRAREAGVADKVDIRVMDWRELDAEPFDAISSIGMVEHVGSVNIDAYAARIASLMRPGGRLLNHGIARLRHTDPEAGPFSERYVFPDAAPLHLSRITFALERAGLEVTHAEGFRDDYAETLSHWSDNFDSNLQRAIELGGEERVRVFRLYLRTARRGFETGFLSIFQVVARKP